MTFCCPILIFNHRLLHIIINNIYLKCFWFTRCWAIVLCTCCVFMYMVLTTASERKPIALTLNLTEYLLYHLLFSANYILTMKKRPNLLSVISLWKNISIHAFHCIPLSMVQKMTGCIKLQNKFNARIGWKSLWSHVNIQLFSPHRKENWIFIYCNIYH